MTTGCTTAQRHSAGEGCVLPVGWSCCAKAAQDTHLYSCLDLLSRMWESWKETTTQLEAWSCTAHSSACSLSPLFSIAGAKSHSFPFLASVTMDETCIYPLLFPEMKGIFWPGLWHRANVLKQLLLVFSSTKWGERYFSPLWSFQRCS